jgi:NTP pyrophosphatase (non-canonical NTP hydrolase)
MTFRQLQDEHREWVDRNFPGSKDNQYHPFLGLVEEVGEFAHVFLKSEQGIREGRNLEQIQALKEDAVGDIIIYLADLCTKHGIDMQDAIDKTWGEVQKRDWNKNKTDGSV